MKISQAIISKVGPTVYVGVLSGLLKWKLNSNHYDSLAESDFKQAVYDASRELVDEQGNFLENEKVLPLFNEAIDELVTAVENFRLGWVVPGLEDFRREVTGSLPITKVDQPLPPSDDPAPDTNKDEPQEPFIHV
jgi:hypothetical protein